jgi:hypothetical protein
MPYAAGKHLGLGRVSAIGEYLEGRGWIAEADPDYRIFVFTVAGIDVAIS